MFAERLKMLRTLKKITQVELAEMLNVSKGTVGMWETGKRVPSFEAVDEMTTIFDRRMDYILGYSDDTSSPMPRKEDIDQLGIWLVQDDFTEMGYQYLMLDSYGQAAVESLIKAETRRCRDQETLASREDFNLSVKVFIKPEDQYF